MPVILLNISSAKDLNIPIFTVGTDVISLKIWIEEKCVYSYYYFDMSMAWLKDFCIDGT